MLKNEMDLVVAPLIAAKEKEGWYFGYAIKPSQETWEKNFYYFEFWQNIRLNRYLTKVDLKEAIDDYFAATKAYWENYDASTTEYRVRREAAKEKLFDALVTRQKELQNELDRINIQLEKLIDI